jgi:hypothetical protein
MAGRFGMVCIFCCGAAAGILGLTALQRGLDPVAHAQTGGCMNTTFKGTYGVLAQGAAPGDNGTVPVGAVFVATADGAGNITLGGPNPPMGTYSVNADCTFTVSLTPLAGVAVGSGANSALGVLVDGGKRIFGASTNPSSPKTFIGERE